MKKIGAFILTAVMFMTLAVPALAVTDGPNFGDVPKTAAVINIDGVRDDIYDQGLKLNIDKFLSDSQEPQGGGGTAWVLWDDAALYVFVDVAVKEYYDSGDNAEKAISLPWDLDNVEVLLDFTNSGEVPVQYRINLDAFPNVTLPGEPAANGEECKPYLDYSGKRNGNTYTCEYKIKFDRLINEKVIADDVKAAKKIGIQMMVTDAYDGGQTNYMLIEGLAPWGTEGYGWVTLSDSIVGGVVEAEPEAEPEPETKTSVSEPDPISAPQTSDTSLLIFAVLMIAAAAGMFGLRKNRQ